MNMSFKTIYYAFYTLWAVVWVFMAFRFVAIINEVKPLTIHDVYTDSSGPSGVVKGYYIKQYHHGGPALIRRGSDTTRDYAGFTLARLLYPTSRINNARTVTFYAEIAADHKSITHFAAKAGTEPASKLRLIIDIIDHVLLKFSLLNTAFFIGSAYLGDLYKRFKKGQDVSAEVKEVYDRSNLQIVGMFALLMMIVI